jgi:hypothetical protein
VHAGISCLVFFSLGAWSSFLQFGVSLQGRLWCAPMPDVNVALCWYEEILLFSFD